MPGTMPDATAFTTRAPEATTTHQKLEPYATRHHKSPTTQDADLGRRRLRQGLMAI